jgi:dienelactone hydrolase
MPRVTVASRGPATCTESAAPLMKSPLLAALGLVLVVAAAAAAPNEAAWRAQIAAALHLSSTLPPLSAETHGRFEPEPGVVAERVSYSTRYGMRVPAIFYYPEKRAGKIPALIVVNGHGGDKFSWYAHYTGILYARAGAAVLTFDPLGEGERNPERKSGTRAHDAVEKIIEIGPRMGGQMMDDVRQAVSFLAARAEIDGGRIAAAGYSLGSFVLSLTGAVEPRLRACVLTGGGNLDARNGYWDGAKPLCQGWPYQALLGLGDRAAVIYALHAARGATLIYNGDHDDVVAIPRMGEPFFQHLRRRTIALRGNAENIFEHVLEPGPSHRPYFITRPVALWLERTLDLPNWTADSIQSMPHTRIGDWATERGVDMDRLYATEERESGTRALGQGIPAPTRSQLYVFSEAEWREKKPVLTIDHWVRHVRKQIGLPAQE